jgi:adenylate cyclase
LLLRAGACVVISVALAGLTAALASVNRFTRFEGDASDLAFPRGDATPSVAVVAVDTRSLLAVDPSWPWPRREHAELIRALHEAGAKLIVYDITFVAPAPGDDELAEAISSAGNVVLGASAYSPQADEASDGEDDAGASSTGIAELQRFDVVRPIDALAEAAVGIGHTQIVLDGTDGVVRQLPLVVEDQDRRVVPALSLAALAAESEQPVEPIVRQPTGVQVGDRAIPTDRDHDLRISYSDGLSALTSDDVETPGWEGPIYSAADVLAGDFETAPVRDKVVFVGATDVSLGDRLLTPVSKQIGLPGVLVHANAYSTMVDRSYVAPAATLEIALTVLLVSLVLTFAVQFLPLWAWVGVAAGMLVAYLLAAYLRADTGTIMNFTYPTIAVALAVPSSLGVRYFGETRQRRRVNALFSQYVPAHVAKQLIDEGRVDTVMEGQRVEVTTMFSDLRGFTEYSARLAPAEVNAMLTDFYEYVSQRVLAHGGTVMTYIGDDVFSIFGAPVPFDDHQARAVACARELQENIEELDRNLQSHGFEKLRFGIGLNAGEVVASHIGSNWRRQYTAIGTTVNIASRLCSHAGPGQIVLSESVRAGIDPPPNVDAVGPLEMKGVSKDFVAWRLVLEREPSGTRNR